MEYTCTLVCNILCVSNIKSININVSQIINITIGPFCMSGRHCLDKEISFFDWNLSLESLSFIYLQLDQ